MANYPGMKPYVQGGGAGEFGKYYQGSLTAKKMKRKQGAMIDTLIKPRVMKKDRQKKMRRK
jgi:hypothetical protein